MNVTLKKGTSRRQESSVSQGLTYWVKFNKNKNYISFLFTPSYVPDTVLDLPDEASHCAHVTGEECKTWVKKPDKGPEPAGQWLKRRSADESGRGRQIVNGLRFCQKPDVFVGTGNHQR